MSGMPIKIADVLVEAAERVPFMPSPDVERVAKAIHAAMSKQRDWATEAETMKNFYRECALAGMIELRDPTEKMLRAEMDKGGYGYGEGECYSADPREIWLAMFDAMLK